MFEIRKPRTGPGPAALTGVLATGPGALTVARAAARERLQRRLPRGCALTPYLERPGAEAVHVELALGRLLYGRHGWSASGTRPCAIRQRSHANSFQASPTCIRRAVSDSPLCQLHQAIARGSSVSTVTGDASGEPGGDS